MAAPLMMAPSALDCAIEQPDQQGQPFGCVPCQHGAGVADQTLSVHRHAPYRVEAASACLAARGSDYFGGAVVDSAAAVPGANVFTRRQKIQHASSTAIAVAESAPSVAPAAEDPGSPRGCRRT